MNKEATMVAMLFRGALAGAVATLPMTFVMEKLAELLPEREREKPLPPEEVASRLLGRQNRGATLLDHFGFGAICGALYAITLGRRHRRDLLKGPLFGALIWASSYGGWLPALGIRQSLKRDSRERNLQMGLAHLTWGFAMARLLEMNRKEWVKEIAKGVTKAPRGARFLAGAI